MSKNRLLMRVRPSTEISEIATAIAFWKSYDSDQIEIVHDCSRLVEGNLEQNQVSAETQLIGYNVLPKRIK